jgi:hypothetical protein
VNQAARLALLTAAVTATGCTHSSSAARLPADRCALLPQAEAEQIDGFPLHRTLLPSPRNKPPLPDCLYLGDPFLPLPAAGEVRSPAVRLRAVSGGAARRVFVGMRDHAPAEFPAERLSGVGDEALWVDHAQIMAMVDGVRLEVTVVDDHGPSQAKAAEVIARVSARLKPPSRADVTPAP